MRIRTTGLLAAWLASAFLALAEVPLQMNTQGLLLDDNGDRVSGNVTIVVSVYTNESAGNSVYTEDLGSVVVSNGVYSIVFGSGILTTALANHDECWLQVSVDGVPLSPRHRLVSVPYAVVANSVQGAALYVSTNGKVGIGTTSPSNDLHVVGTVRVEDGTQADSKVLTSDAQGDARWAYPVPPSLFKHFSGDGSDGDIVVSVNTDFSDLTGSTNDFILQAANFTVQAGCTVTVDTGWAFIGVRGTCAVHGTISADGQGEAGGKPIPDANGNGRPGKRGDGIGDTDRDLGGAASGVDYSGEAMPAEPGQIAQMPVSFCLAGAGGGGAAASNGHVGGYGGGGAGGGGKGGLQPQDQGKGQDGQGARPAKLMALTGGLGNNSGDSHGAPLLTALQFRGGGGGSGAAESGGSTGYGGRGGGIIYVECDDLQFGGSLSANGANGQSNPGGGGGGGGVIVVRTKLKTLSTGTITVSGGAGGNSGQTYGGGGGADGFRDIVDLP
jgi:hypothetical protein